MAKKKTSGKRTQADSLIPAERIEQNILLIRGEKVMLDSDLAVLYEVETRVLNQAVKWNLGRFPEDFMCQLTEDEAAALRSQTVTLKTGRGQHRKYTPCAFTEQGVAILSSVLRSERAVQVNVEIMRTFVKLRRILSEHQDLSRKLAVLENKYDEQFRVVFDAICQLMAPPRAETSRGRIGFGREGEK
ncbi:MAG: ORF6N domain-containing protein [Planctomycetota bacterium]|nr:ORF6N domain-containing protein [Planctomycetota bacterium]